MIGFEEAQRLAATVARPLGAETVPLSAAQGRRLAEPVVAAHAAPVSDVAAMDGYAVRDADLARTPAALPIAGENFAGAGGPAVLPAGACMRIFTGAPAPKGADRVIMQEDVRREGDVAVFERAPSLRRHIRTAGSDFSCGETLLPASAVLTAQALVAAAAADRAAVRVFRQPRVATVATGDELAAPGDAHAPAGSVPDSVSVGVRAMAETWGGRVVSQVRRRDDLPALVRAADEALDAADVVVVTGGASVGQKDYARAMFAPHGLRLIFAKVAIKPGKPVWLGVARGVLVLGLPGNPTSALVTARLFLAPILVGHCGADPAEALAWRTLPLAAPIPQAGDRETFSRGRTIGGGVELLADQDASAQAALAKSEWLVRRRPGEAAAAVGEPATCLPL